MFSRYPAPMPSIEFFPTWRPNRPSDFQRLRLESSPVRTGQPDTLQRGVLHRRQPRWPIVGRRRTHGRAQRRHVILPADYGCGFAKFTMADIGCRDPKKPLWPRGQRTPSSFATGSKSPPAGACERRARSAERVNLNRGAAAMQCVACVAPSPTRTGRQREEPRVTRAETGAVLKKTAKAESKQRRCANCGARFDINPRESANDTGSAPPRLA